MFIQFNVGNFRSFKDLSQFSMEASPIRSNDSGLDEANVIQGEKIRLLKTKAVYGGNASGKSNLAIAISAFVYMVSRSVADEGIPSKIWEDRFQLADESWDEQPVFFQYIFTVKDEVYRYGFQILNNSVHYEWLFSGLENQNELFLRTPDHKVSVNPEFFNPNDPFIIQTRESDNELYRSDSLFLTAGALNGNALLSNIRNEIRRIIAADGAYDDSAINYAMQKFVKGNDEEKRRLTDLIKAADTGIEALEIAELPDHLIERNSMKDTQTVEGKKKPVSLFSQHSKFNSEGQRIGKVTVRFSEWESRGTAKILGLGSLLLDALLDGRVMVVDEFDARLHPNLTLKIVEFFNKTDTNPHNAQLIFITHDTTLLKRAKLRRDQMCLVKKNKYGISSLTNLIEFKGVRKDASYDKEYLNGTYSAIPYLEKMDWVVKQNNLEHGLQQAK